MCITHLLTSCKIYPTTSQNILFTHCIKDVRVHSKLNPVSVLCIGVFRHVLTFNTHLRSREKSINTDWFTCDLFHSDTHPLNCQTTTGLNRKPVNFFVAFDRTNACLQRSCRNASFYMTFFYGVQYLTYRVSKFACNCVFFWWSTEFYFKLCLILFTLNKICIKLTVIFSCWHHAFSMF